jgi:hypothetical protein
MVRYKRVRNKTEKRYVVKTVHYQMAQLQNGTCYKNGTLLQNGTVLKKVRGRTVHYRNGTVSEWIGWMLSLP